MDQRTFDNALKEIEARARRYGPMRDSNAYGKIHGACDDTAEVWLRIDGGKVRKGSFMSDGCGVSKQCCDTAVALVAGMTVDEAANMTQEQVLEATGPLPEDHLHCALLAADTVKLAVENYLNPPEKTALGSRIKNIFSKERDNA